MKKHNLPRAVYSDSQKNSCLRVVKDAMRKVYGVEVVTERHPTAERIIVAKGTIPIELRRKALIVLGFEPEKIITMDNACFGFVQANQLALKMSLWQACLKIKMK